MSVALHEKVCHALRIFAGRLSGGERDSYHNRLYNFKVEADGTVHNFNFSIAEFGEEELAEGAQWRVRIEHYSGKLLSDVTFKVFSSDAVDRLVKQVTSYLKEEMEAIA